MTELHDVSDTARWVAHYRALESQRPDALFVDSLASRLAGDTGRQMAEHMPKVSLSWAIAVRTRVYDELILDAIEGDRATAVVNIAAGMDARPYRLQLPTSLHWTEIDLPDLVTEKNALLAREKPSCQLERVALDLADRRALGAALDRVAARHASIVVITEGLLAYLPQSAVDDLARDLHARAPIASWVLEAALPEVVRCNPRAWRKHFDKAGIAMQLAPPEGIDYFRQHGWTPRTRRSCLLEARRLHREPPFANLLHFIKSLTPNGRQWLHDVVAYGVIERAHAPQQAP